ncbi:RNase P modulator RnpM [Paenibacillus yanchengensis]|uniref:RNase P modulator RnpM n=1 Tax=Paenibacillus yanchengensis TaxID=2035833 RepID=A0ABW4YMH1_9BACL
MKPRKVPLRKCVACQEMMPKRELIRVVRTPDEEIMVDLTGKKAGRGAYLCGKLNCFALAQKSKALDRALKQTVDEAVYVQLKQQFIAVEQQFIANKGNTNDES